MWKTRSGQAVIFTIGLASVIIIVEHGEHLLPYAPYLLLLLCPVLHIFMHRKHDSHEVNSKTRKPEDNDAN